MASTPSEPPSEPDAPPPLSDHEQRILDAIGQDLASESPRLGQQLSTPPRRPAPRRGGSVDDAICVAIGLLILWVLLPHAWFVVAFMIVAMTAPALLMTRHLPHDDRGDGTSGRAPDTDDRH